MRNGDLCGILVARSSSLEYLCAVHIQSMGQTICHSDAFHSERFPNDYSKMKNRHENTTKM